MGPGTLDKILFVTGILAMALGQVVLNLLRSPSLSRTLYYEAPIDYGHWLLLVGAVLMIPFAARLPRRGIDLVAGPLLVVGIACVIGMCTLDLVMWSYAGGPGRDALTRQLTAEPSIWMPFITIGPTYLFGVGLVLPSLSYWSVSKPGVGLVVGSALGFLTILAGVNPWFFAVGYAVIAGGYGLCFRSDPAAVRDADR